MSSVLARKIQRTRRDHRIGIGILAMLAGLSEQQVISLENDAQAGFIEEAHRIDCARRLAVALGYPGDHFLAPATLPEETEATEETTAETGASSMIVPRSVWAGLPAASLTILENQQSIALEEPIESVRASRRSITPARAAPVIAALIAAILLSLSLVH